MNDQVQPVPQPVGLDAEVLRQIESILHEDARPFDISGRVLQANRRLGLAQVIREYRVNLYGEER